jgi:hypothetical protein
MSWLGGTILSQKSQNRYTLLYTRVVYTVLSVLGSLLAASLGVLCMVASLGGLCVRLAILDLSSTLLGEAASGEEEVVLLVMHGPFNQHEAMRPDCAGDRRQLPLV